MIDEASAFGRSVGAHEAAWQVFGDGCVTVEGTRVEFDGRRRAHIATVATRPRHPHDLGARVECRIGEHRFEFALRWRLSEPVRVRPEVLSLRRAGAENGLLEQVRIRQGDRVFHATHRGDGWTGHVEAADTGRLASPSLVLNSWYPHANQRVDLLVRSRLPIEAKIESGAITVVLAATDLADHVMRTGDGRVTGLLGLELRFELRLGEYRLAALALLQSERDFSERGGVVAEVVNDRLLDGERREWNGERYGRTHVHAWEDHRQVAGLVLPTRYQQTFKGGSWSATVEFDPAGSAQDEEDEHFDFKPLPHWSGPGRIDDLVTGGSRAHAPVGGLTPDAVVAGSVAAVAERSGSRPQRRPWLTPRVGAIVTILLLACFLVWAWQRAHRRGAVGREGGPRPRRTHRP